MYTDKHITSERIIKPYRSGIQLLKQDQASGNRLRVIYDSSITAYFKSTDSRVVAANEASAELNGVNSTRDLIGTDAHDIWDNEAASRMHASDQHVMRSETLQISDFSASRTSDHSHQQMISFKMPWYEQDKVIGIYGMTLPYNPKSLVDFAKNLTTIIAAGLVNSSKLSTMQTLMQPVGDEVYLSKREIDILKLLVENLSARQIAEKLIISKRTVENNIANIKIKTNCASKYALIEKFYWKLKNNDVII